MTGIVARLTEQSLAAADAMLCQTAGDALAKLKAFLADSVRWKAENIGDMRYLTDVLSKPGNDILFRRMFDATAAAVVPMLEDIIAEGATDGSFDVADPGLAAEMIVGLSHGRRQVFDGALAIAVTGDLDRAIDHLEARMRAEGLTCDRLLGLPRGTISLSHPDAYHRILASLVAPVLQTEDHDV